MIYYSPIEQPSIRFTPSPAQPQRHGRYSHQLLMKNADDSTKLREAARQIVQATKGTLEGRMNQRRLTIKEARQQTQTILEAQRKRLLEEFGD